MMLRINPSVTSVLLVGVLLATLVQLNAASGTGITDPRDSLTFVYLHGFGGAKESPKFCENMSAFLRGAGSRSRVINYEWDSGEVEVQRAGASWIASQKMADAEAVRFKEEVISPLEEEGVPYVLIGYSVGSRVILGALDATRTELSGLRGVYFVGSAMTKDTTLVHRAALPEGMKITNFHSPSRDLVHRMAFSFMSDVPAGGQVGFDDALTFENYPVSCSHLHLGAGALNDYSGLAEAIAYLELYEVGVMLPGRTKINLETPVSDGESWWNRIKSVRIESEDGAIVAVDLEQHSLRPQYYRALRVEGDGSRTRLARGENLHAILEKVGVGPGER